MIEVLDDLWKIRHPYDALFLELIDGYEIDISDDYPEFIIYMKNKEVLLNYCILTKCCGVSNSLILESFESKFDIEYDELMLLMIKLLDIHLKLEVISPIGIIRLGIHISSDK